MNSKVSVLTTECKRCGKRYGILEKHISGNGGRFACKHCGNRVIIRKNATVQTVALDSLPGWVQNHERGPNNVNHQEIPLVEAMATEPSTETTPTLDDSAIEDFTFNTDVNSTNTSSAFFTEVESESSHRFGLTGKFLVFTLIPLVIISVLSILYTINKMLTFQNATVQESTQIVKDISEGMLRQAAINVARQTRQYLFTQPDLKREQFNRNIYFKKVAIQRVGITGRTSLYEIAGPDDIWRVWADADAQLVGSDLRGLKERLGKHFDAYWQLMTGVKNNQIVSGYFQWPDETGRFREKFMVSTPVDGTPYAVAASIYVDEITLPLVKIRESGSALARDTRNKNVAIMVGGLLLVGLIAYLYGRGLTAKIHALSDWADRISLGELELESLPVTSNDELGELSKAIARMQDSIRLSVERLRRRRR